MLQPSSSDHPAGHPLPLALTMHACTRMQQRGIRISDVQQVLRYGRCIHARGVEFHVVGHKEVERWASQGVQLAHLAGLQVLATQEGIVITTYRNHDLHAIQAQPRRFRRSRIRRLHH